MPECQRRVVCAWVVTAMALALVACGGDDANPDDRGSAQDRQIERAFLASMVPHHESAIEMAALARRHGRDPFVKRLAASIARTQRREIALMEGIHRRLFDGELEPDPHGHRGLGLNAAEAGMTHDAEAARALGRAKPFDRAFVDEMVPHHRGALAMARVLLANGQDEELRRLATEIIEAQRREITAMNEFRVREFGAPAKAGAGHGAAHGKAAEEKHGAGH